MRSPETTMTHLPVRTFVWGAFDPYARFAGAPSPGGPQGWYSDHPIFEKLLAARRPKRIAEVGTLFGASSVHMARIAQRLDLEAEITCVDTFLGSREGFFEFKHFRDAMLARGQYGFFEEFLGNVKAAGMAHCITPFPMTSVNAARIFAEKGMQFDLVYIDASHEYVDVLSDLRLWWPLVAPGGVLFGDDFEEPWFDIIRAGMEFADEIGEKIRVERAFASSPAGGRENTKFVFEKKA
jgi:SAM-dependent methyltransferase